MGTGIIIDCVTGEARQVDVPDTSASIPDRVTPRQAKLALLNAGLLDDTEALINAADKATQIAWNNALEFLRTDPLITTLGAALGLSDAQIDDLFIQAAQL